MWPGPAVVFEDRFFSFLQEQDFNGSMVAFLAVYMYLPFLLLGCVRSTNLRFILQICRDEHLGYRCKYVTVCVTFRVSRSV